MIQAPRPRFRFEYERKAEILAFLNEHYQQWRAFDAAKADRLVTLSLADARKSRALADLPAVSLAVVQAASFLPLNVSCNLRTSWPTPTLSASVGSAS